MTQTKLGQKRYRKISFRIKKVDEHGQMTETLAQMPSPPALSQDVQKSIVSTTRPASPLPAHIRQQSSTLSLTRKDSLNKNTQIERQAKLSGSSNKLTLKELNDSLSNLFPASPNQRIRKAFSRNSLQDNFGRQSGTVSAGVEGSFPFSPTDVYHTVHGRGRNTILASRSNEPFSRIVRRQRDEEEVVFAEIHPKQINSSPVVREIE